MTSCPFYWQGRLSMAAALSVQSIKQGRPKDAAQDLRRTLDEYLRSGAPTGELQSMLREELKR